MEKEGRRNFLARTLEIGSVLPLVYLGVSNSMNSHDHYEVDYSKAVSNEKSGELGEFALANGNFASSLNSLSNAYRNNYRHTEQETYLTFDDEGWPETKTRTVTKWRVPKGMPDRHLISGWSYHFNQISRKSSILAGNQIISAGATDQIRVVKKEDSAVGRTVLSCLAYGGAAAGLIGYEELRAMKAKDRGKKESLGDYINRKNTPAQLTRRSLFKVLAGAAAGTVAFILGNYNENNREKARSVLEREVENNSRKLEDDPSKLFNEYFGFSPYALRGQALGYGSTAAAARGRAGNSEVENALNRVVSRSKHYGETIDGLFKEDVPYDFTKSIASMNVMEELDKVSSNEKAKSYMTIPMQFLAVAGTMAAILIPGEWANKRIAAWNKDNAKRRGEISEKKERKYSF